MRIAITGASGFLGRPLVHQLVARGHSVLALGRDPEALRRWLPAGAEAAPFDAQRPQVPATLLQGCEAVVNLAGELIAQRWTPAVKRRIRDSRVLGTQAIAGAACAAGTVRTFLSASAVGFYGPRGDEPLSESEPPGDDFLGRVCAEWEAATAPALACGLRVAILRIGVVFHPEGAALKKMLPLFKLGLGGPMGGGAQVMAWVHRDDALAAIQHLLDTPSLSGAFNVVAPGAVSSRQLAQALGKSLGRPAVLPAPAFALRLALGEMSAAVLTGQRPVPARLQQSGFQFRYPTLAEALPSFGYGRAKAASPLT